MKPKRIELEGFTAYRQQTVIDFEDADLFVIVGATGSGKSSIIDAMIFALYGSVPRFDDQKLVQPVISQGRNEARVRFHFALDGKDYSVARVVRRVASDPTRASTKEARLESGTEVIASGAPEVTQAVIDRIGLSFDQFTRCVVLPQGAFARFLHDKPKARQDLLNKLLGLGLYERLAARAREAARDADARMEAYAQQLEALAGFTADRERHAAARAKSIAVLAARFRVERSSIEGLGREAADVGKAADEDDADRLRLAAVAVPSEVTALADRRAGLRLEQRAASTEIDYVRQRLAGAQRRRGELGELAPLVRLQDLLRQLADKRGSIPPERMRLDEATEADQRAEGFFLKCAEQRGKLGDLEPLVRRRGLLRQLAAAREEVAAAAGRRAAARQSLDEARSAREAATSRLETLGDVDALIALRDLMRQLQAKRDRLTGAAVNLGNAREQAQQARHEWSGAEQAEREARDWLDRVKAEHYAHELRTGLRAGEPCPVCEQEVTSLPPASSPGGLRDAENSLAAAARRRSQSAEAHARAAAAASAADQAHASLLDEIDDAEKRTVDSGIGSPAEVDVRIDAARAGRENANQTGMRCAEAQATLTAAEEREQALERSVANIERQLGGVSSGQALTEAEIAERIRAIRAAEAQLDEARAAHGRTREKLAGVETRYTALTRDVADLGERTQGAPPPAEVDVEIDTIHEVETELDRLRAEQRDATERLERCSRELDALAGDEHALWRRLDALRVSVVRHAPPELDRQAGLGSSWDTMAAWAVQTAADLQERVDSARDQASTLAAQRQERLEAFLTALEEIGVGAAPEAPAAEAGIGDLLARREAEASAELDAIRSKLDEKEGLKAQRDAARKRGLVAGRLGRLLGTAHFQRWRLTGAFEQLVAAASRWLRELSGNTYSLAHSAQLGFEVVDHANADDRRPVRTLSGGETFLASLSMALALADQVADLASSGAARLESMFLDEGFGSLDPETLDSVAAALEELGSTGRTLGIVTHVPALAERVPVQFRVTKDASTARVERVAS